MGRFRFDPIRRDSIRFDAKNSPDPPRIWSDYVACISLLSSSVSFPLTIPNSNPEIVRRKPIWRQGIFSSHANQNIENNSDRQFCPSSDHHKSYAAGAARFFLRCVVAIGASCKFGEFADAGAHHYTCSSSRPARDANSIARDSLFDVVNKSHRIVSTNAGRASDRYDGCSWLVGIADTPTMAAILANLNCSRNGRGVGSEKIEFYGSPRIESGQTQSRLCCGSI